jgi:hypothetical protein
MQSDGPRCIEPLNIELHERPQLEVVILALTAVLSRASPVLSMSVVDCEADLPLGHSDFGV